ncbi:MAG: DNA/RNA nuclease SfsA [Hyphomicrobiales bacterium]
MKFPAPLVKGRLVHRYKRFLADVELATGEVVTAHCANPGAMLGLKEPGLVVWLSPAQNPARKLQWDWQLCRVEDFGIPALVGINTSNPNKIVGEAIAEGKIPELAGYAHQRAEVKYGKNSRIDILLEDEDKPPCYVEIKNVHLLRQQGLAEFPDSVTARGAKHLRELSDMVSAGNRAVMLYLVQRDDADRLQLAADIDPHYAESFDLAHAAGVEGLAYCCKLDIEGIEIDRRLVFFQTQLEKD